MRNIAGLDPDGGSGDAERCTDLRNESGGNVVVGRLWGRQDEAVVRGTP